MEGWGSLIARIFGLLILCSFGYALNAFWIVDGMITLVGTSILFGGCLGIGWVLDERMKWDLALAIGIGLLGTALLPISMLLGPQFGLCLLLIGWWKLWTMRWDWSFSMNNQWLLVVLLLVIAIWSAHQLIIDTDSLYYHAALPKHMWHHNQLLGGELHPNGSRPLIWHLPLTLAYGLGRLPGVQLFASCVSIAAWLSLSQTCERSNRGTGWWVWLLVLGSYSVLEQTFTVANNVVVLWWVFLAFRERNHTLVWGLLLGFAVAGKFTAIGVATLIGLLTHHSLRSKVQTIGVVCGIVSIWLLRNLIDGMHPLFPYAGWDIDMPFVWVEKYGMGRDWQALLHAPWNLLVHAEIDSFQFLGQLSPAFGLLGGWSVLSLARHRQWREGLLLLGAFAWWFMGPHWIRHLFPMLGVFIVIGTERLTMSPSKHLMFVLAVIMGAPANIQPFIKQQSDRVLGDRSLPGMEATQWLNRHTGDGDGTVALFCLWTGAYLDRPYVLSSVEDHTPIRHLSLKYGADAIPFLKRNGVRYVAFGPHQFYPSAYSFIDDDQLQREWHQPMQSLEDQLLQHGRLIVRIDGVDIYRLD